MMFFIIFLPAILVAIEFIGFLITGHQVLNKIVFRTTELATMILLPYLYLDISRENECCGDTAAFSPRHITSVITLIILCLSAYFYCSYRSKLVPPLMEVLLNLLLVLGIVFNIFVSLHTKEFLLAMFGNYPVIILAILVLAKNQKMFVEGNRKVTLEASSWWTKMSWKILCLQPVAKYPILLILCLPVLVVIAMVLLLFGQKPDSFIRAFTETYRHGFSQWDYKCDNVVCGSHYLCSVAANGHHGLVRPVRMGVRRGGNIICNRQLLISNAFEDLIQEKFPFLHKVIRTQYDKVGKKIHRYYRFFGNRYVSDLVYLFMKPLELVFLIVLYCIDHHPENRIAIQYISAGDRNKIISLQKKK